MTTIIDSITVEDPDMGLDGVAIQHVDLAALLDLADGSTVLDYINEKERYAVRWSALTDAQLATLESAIAGPVQKAKNLEVQLPHQAAHVHCFIMPNTYKKAYEKDGSGAWRWRVDVQFVEVS